MVTEMDSEVEVEEESEDEGGINTTDLAMRRGAGVPEKDSETQHIEPTYAVFSETGRTGRRLLNNEVLDRGREVAGTRSGRRFARKLY